MAKIYNASFLTLGCGAVQSLLIIASLICMINLQGKCYDKKLPTGSSRKFGFYLTQFGGVGDGKTSNTKVFRFAIDYLSRFGPLGSAVLVVPPGKWLTASFNLTSNFTLYLQKDTVLLSIKDETDWPVLPHLPSYGREPYYPDGRYSSLIFGTNLTDVVITGENATIDGQGYYWWDKSMLRSLTSNATLLNLIEIMYSDQVQIFNLTLLNSVYSHVHPYHSSNVIVKNLTITTPMDILINTYGINPDSCTNVRIGDNFINTRSDCIGVKSGLHIEHGKPTEHVIIKNLTCDAFHGAAIAVTGRVQDVHAENINARCTDSAIRTTAAMGGYIKDIFVKDVTLDAVQYVIHMTTTENYSQPKKDLFDPHPGEDFHLKALPIISGISYQNIRAKNVIKTASMNNFHTNKATNICVSNVTVELIYWHEIVQWECFNIEGVSSGVSPKACHLLKDKQPGKLVACPFPTNKLTIEDVPLKVSPNMPKQPPIYVSLV